MVSTHIVQIGPGQKKENKPTQAVLAGDFMYLSGQYPKDLVTGKILSKNIQDQIRAIFFNLSKILSAQSLSLSNIVKITAYLRSEGDAPVFENALAAYFESHHPALTVVLIDRFLYKDAQLCVDAVAFVERD